jgi:Ubiquitin carboxyl-terminal hydrolase
MLSNDWLSILIGMLVVIDRLNRGQKNQAKTGRAGGLGGLEGINKTSSIDLTKFSVVDGLRKNIDIAQLGNASAKEKQAIEELSLQRWREHLSKNQSIVSDVMMGQYLIKIECTMCETAGYNFEPFYILDLEIPGGIEEISLGDLLEYSSKSELVEGLKWQCTKCGKGTQVTKARHIYKLPSVLAVSFKRFEADSNYQQKNSCMITTQLYGENLSRFEKGSVEGNTKIYLPYMIVVSCGQIASSWRDTQRTLQLHFL